MRRITCIALVICLCLNLTACDSDSGGEENNTAGTEEERQEEAFEAAGACLKRMTLDEKIGQMFLMDVDCLTKDSRAVTAATPELLKVIEKYKIGGVVFHTQNVTGADQIRTMLQKIRDFTDESEELKVPLYLAGEEEGGGSRSLAANTKDITSTGFASPSEMGQNMTESQLKDAGKVIAGGLSELGFNMNMAPPADVFEAEKMADVQAVNASAARAAGEKPVYVQPSKKLSKAKRKKRLASYNKKLQEYQERYDAYLKRYTETDFANSCFGDDEEKVGDAVAAMVEGMHTGDTGGVCTVLKTFPGIAAVARYHKIIPTEINTGLSRLRRVNFAPFKEGIGASADFIMVGHVALSKIDGDTPSSLSETILTKLLRGEMKYEGILVTEPLHYPVITDRYTTKQAVVQAVAAGADMIYDPEDLDEAVSAIKQAVMFREIDEKVIDRAVLRILQNKILRGVYPQGTARNQ